MKSRRGNKGNGQSRLIIPALLLLMVAAPIIYLLGCKAISNPGRTTVERGYGMREIKPAPMERVQPKLQAVEAANSLKEEIAQITKAPRELAKTEKQLSQTAGPSIIVPNIYNVIVYVN